MSAVKIAPAAPAAERLDQADRDRLREVAQQLGLNAADLKLDDDELSNRVLTACGYPPATTRCTSDSSSPFIADRGIWYRAARAIAAGDREVKERADQRPGNGVHDDQEDEEQAARQRRVKADATRWAQGGPHEEREERDFDRRHRFAHEQQAARAAKAFEPPPPRSTSTDREVKAREARKGREADRSQRTARQHKRGGT